MAIQKDVDLNKPLDPNVTPTLSQTKLTPELSQAVLSLHGDRYRQLQSKCNRHVVWHPLLVATLGVLVAIYAVFQFWNLIVVLQSFGEFWHLVLRNKYLLALSMPGFVLSFTVIALSSFIISDEFRTVSDRLVKPDYLVSLFGFELKKYAQLSTGKDADNRSLSPKEAKLLHEGSQNTQVLIYRDSPIAAVTVVPLLQNSTESNFFVKITGLNVRKVFAKVDFDNLLVEWSILRSRELLQDYAASKKVKNVDGAKVTVLVDAYSIDAALVATLKQNSFTKIKSSLQIDPFVPESAPTSWNVFYTVLHKFFRVSRDTYALTLVAQNDDKDLLLKAARESSLTESSTKQQAPAKGLRKRK